MTLLQGFPPLCARLLFVVNRLTVFLSFCYIECELFAVFMILFDNWRRFCRPSVIYVPVKCPRGGGIWSPEWTLVWGIWTAFWPWWGEGGWGVIWTIIFKKVKCPGGCPGNVEASIWPIHYKKPGKKLSFDSEVDHLVTERSLRIVRRGRWALGVKADKCWAVKRALRSSFNV